MSKDGVSIQIKCTYNPNTDNVGIHSSIYKSHGYNDGLKTNKNCGHWLGNKAEIILMNMFERVERMEFGNQGYDFICGSGYKIDAKSACHRKNTSTRWTFRIDRNKITDYFLCLAFDDRENLTPLHVWLIPGAVLNNYTGVGISESTLHKWSKYEQPLDKVLSCCNTMKSKLQIDN